MGSPGWQWLKLFHDEGDQYLAKIKVLSSGIWTPCHNRKIVTLTSSCFKVAELLLEKLLSSHCSVKKANVGVHGQLSLTSAPLSPTEGGHCSNVSPTSMPEHFNPLCTAKYTMEPQRLGHLQAYNSEQGVRQLPENESRAVIQSIPKIPCLIGDNVAKSDEQGIQPASGVRPVEGCCISTDIVRPKIYSVGFGLRSLGHVAT